MQQLARRLALCASFLVAAPMAAQRHMPPMPPGGPGDGGPMAGASFLLAHTGELQLTDQQVTRLAVIARREGAQRRGMMTMADSMRRAHVATARRDSAGRRRREIPPQLMARLTQAQEQRKTNLRDAIAVLTPDQQAEAWQMVAGRGRMPRGGMGRARMGGARARGQGGPPPEGVGPQGGRDGGARGGRPGVAPGRGGMGGAIGGQRGRPARPGIGRPEELP